MIKFFRKIRYNLIETGKTGKYFKYAIGEIILVVIGILIALQINNWNEKRQTNIAERNALIALKIEFEQNIKRLEIICKHRKTAEVSFRKYYELITNDTISNEIKAKKRLRSGFGGTWDIKNTVLEGLMNSGNIENIKNDSLKKLLSWWPNRVKRWTEIEKRWQVLKNKRQDYTRSKIRIKIPDTLSQKWDYTPHNTANEIELQKVEVVNELEYQNFIAKEISELYVQNLNCNSIFEDYNKIIDALDKEINFKNR